MDALALRLERPDTRKPSVPDPGYMLSARAVSILLAQGGVSFNPLEEIRASGGRVRIQRVDGCLPCHGDQTALLECNRRMLEQLEYDVDPTCLIDSSIQGAVSIHPTARLQRTIVRGPAIIGAGTRLTDAYVGPYTSIGKHVIVEGAEIEHSIVLDGAALAFVGTRLESSVIGQRARVVRSFSLPTAMRMSVGDDAEVLL